MAIERANDAEAFRDFEHEGWEAVSAGYLASYGELTRQSVPAMLDGAGITSGMRVLDVCCGPGMLAAAAAARGADAVGIDFAANVVEQARTLVPEVRFEQGDAEALPFPDDSFDAVLCGYGVIHVPNPEQALKEMARAVRPGGGVAISVWDEPSPRTGFGVFYGVFAALGDPDTGVPHGPDFYQFSTDAKMTAALSAVGLGDCRVVHTPLVWSVPDTDAIWRALLEGGVRARGSLLAQTPDTRAAIKQAVAEALEQFRTAAGGYDVAMPAVVGSGRKR